MCDVERWTIGEDAKLKELRKKKSNSWKDISDHFPNHSVKSCEHRWREIKNGPVLHCF